MSLKKTDMERLKAASLNDRLRKAAPPRAQAKQAPLNEMVAELLERGLEDDAG